MTERYLTDGNRWRASSTASILSIHHASQKNPGRNGRGGASVASKRRVVGIVFNNEQTCGDDEALKVMSKIQGLYGRQLCASDLVSVMKAMEMVLRGPGLLVGEYKQNPGRAGSHLHCNTPPFPGRTEYLPEIRAKPAFQLGSSRISVARIGSPVPDVALHAGIGEEEENHPISTRYRLVMVAPLDDQQ
ncbi:hypothetical protein BGZ63DRAFT_398852 [Mariannaea sp. PMI_226]|nr:hypothetical protein BGZ63DRAFT_398852 [Mariannaea sp. PMI_226]